MPKITRYGKALALLPDTMAWSQGLDITALGSFLTEADGLPRVFLGSGGSLSAAHYAAALSVESGRMAVAMTPYQYIFSPWSKMSAKVVILSAGGRNVDAINAYKTAAGNEAQQTGALIFTPESRLESLMQADGNPNVFVNNLLNSDGFLATNSLLAFYIILTRAYRHQTICISDWSFIKDAEEDFRKFITLTYTLPTDSWDSHNAALYEARETDRFYVLYSPDTLPIAYDLESRFSEGSIGCVQISDYRNFAHGRFNWFHQRKGQTGIIALVSPEGEAIAADILAEIPTDIPVMKLQTASRGAEGTVELLLKSMYLAGWLGRRWGLDIGAPEVAKFGKVIHSKDFINPSPQEVPPAPQHGEELQAATIGAEILALPIPNLAPIRRNIVRGQSLRRAPLRDYLGKLADCGVEHIIEFSSAVPADGFAGLCSLAGMHYHHIPVDSGAVTDEHLLEMLPQLFRLLGTANCYVCCTEGLYQTDIGLAIYYMFCNPHFVPQLIGHIKKGELRCNDIMRRLNGLYKALTPANAERLGISRFSEAEYRRRRKHLLNSNRPSPEKTS